MSIIYLSFFSFMSVFIILLSYIFVSKQGIVPMKNKNLKNEL